jgi:hypothetical protein
VQGIGNQVSLGSLCNNIYKFLGHSLLFTTLHSFALIFLFTHSLSIFQHTRYNQINQFIMFTLRQSLGALAAVAAAPLVSAVPITTYSRTPVTTFSRIGASSNGMDILDLQMHAAMSTGHLTSNTTMSFIVDTHSSTITCLGSWAPEGPFPEGEYVSSCSRLSSNDHY